MNKRKIREKGDAIRGAVMKSVRTFETASFLQSVTGLVIYVKSIPIAVYKSQRCYKK